MPELSLVERYQAYRTRRFLTHEGKFRHWLPRWRTQHRRRILVLSLGITFAAMIAVGIFCHVNMTIGPLLWIPTVVPFFLLWTMLQIISGRQGDAPREALDEWEIEQRNSARSIGLTVTQFVAFIPATYLIVAGTHGVNPSNVPYAGGILVLTALMIGGCSPTMILAWNQPDPELDDHLQEAA